jgi:hypothetical protein
MVIIMDQIITSEEDVAQTERQTKQRRKVL